MMLQVCCGVVNLVLLGSEGEGRDDRFENLLETFGIRNIHADSSGRQQTLDCLAVPVSWEITVSIIILFIEFLPCPSFRRSPV